MQNRDLGEKFRAFGFVVVEINGNSMVEIVAAIEFFKAFKMESPSVFLADVKGKGVSFMENVCDWHGMAPNKEQYQQANVPGGTASTTQRARIGVRPMEKKKIATRDGFGAAIFELGKENPDIYVVDADIGKSCKTVAFRDSFPEQHIKVGIAEQNCAGVAAGLATCGKIPFVATYAVFGSMRMCEMSGRKSAIPGST
jgi:transketolase